MKRRKFLTALGTGAAVAAIAKPAIAQSMPELKWRMTASWPKSLDTLFGACTTIAKYVSEATDGKFQIQTFAAGEIVPALQALDAVQNGTVEMGHTAMYYYIGKDPTWALFCAASVRPQCAPAERLVLRRRRPEADRRIRRQVQRLSACSRGNTGTQMGGWFRKEIKTVDDLKGLKMRIGGWAGKTVAKLGVVPQQIGGGDIYPALEKGVIDAAEWVGPYDDEKLGFYKVAKYYYYPGWWEGGTTNHLLINLAKWNDLPKAYKAIVEAACRLRQRRRAGPLRRAQSAGAQASGRRRHAAAAVQPGDHGSLPEGVERSERGRVGEEPELQEGAGVDRRVPERRESVVAGGRIYLRKLHDPQPHQRLSEDQSDARIGAGAKPAPIAFWCVPGRTIPHLRL